MKKWDDAAAILDLFVQELGKVGDYDFSRGGRRR
jgi:hypothetical protein